MQVRVAGGPRTGLPERDPLHLLAPPEHLACSWKPGTVDVQAQYEYRMNGRVDEYGNYESDDTDVITYQWVGADLGYGKGDGIVAEVERATVDAEAIMARGIYP